MDGAIHRAAGPELLAECRTLHGCQTGQAKATRGYKLPAKYVIHTVGPVWHGGGHNEAELLASCYENSMALALELGCRSVAFPAISTGVYHYPVEEATRIAVKTVRRFLSEHPEGPAVTFVCFNEQTAAAYRREVDRRDKGAVEKIRIFFEWSGNLFDGPTSMQNERGKTSRL